MAGAICTGAEQDAPRASPVQLQLHALLPKAPDPVTGEATPVLHRFVVGAVWVETPFAGPHDPSTAWAESGPKNAKMRKSVLNILPNRYYGV
jgi:hypothetical protein